MAVDSPGFSYRNLPLLLLQARERVISHFRPIMNAHGITEQQWRIVRLLLEAGSLEPREITEICSISSPSLVGILDRMQLLGLVERRRIPHDQRRVKISLTARARKLAAQMLPQIEATYRQIEARVGSEGLQQLHRVLDDLLLTLEPPAGKSAVAEQEEELAATR